MPEPNRKKCGVFEVNNKRINIYEGVNTIGRSKDAIVVLRDPVASQQHAQILVINECHYVSDLKSTNGTLLNNDLLTPFKTYIINDNDEIQFTPIFKGKYRKLDFIDLQLNLTQSQNASQMTQVEDGFYAANTQMNIFNDNLDDELAGIEINTQVIRESVNGRARFPTIHEQATQVETQVLLPKPPLNIFPMPMPMPIVPNLSIHEAATQITDMQPENVSIHEADTQLIAPTLPESTQDTIQACVDMHEAATQYMPITQTQNRPGITQTARVLFQYLNAPSTQVEAEVETEIPRVPSPILIEAGGENGDYNMGAVITCSLTSGEAELVVNSEVVNEVEIETTEQDNTSTPQEDPVPLHEMTQSQSPIMFVRKQSTNPLDSDSDEELNISCAQVVADNATDNIKSDTQFKSFTPMQRPNRRTTNIFQYDSDSDLETHSGPAKVEEKSPQETSERVAAVVSTADHGSDTDIEEEIPTDKKTQPVNVSANVQDNSHQGSPTRIATIVTNTANDSDTDIEEEIIPHKKNIANLSTQTIDSRMNSEQLLKSRLSMESMGSLSLRLSERQGDDVYSDQSTDFLQADNSALLSPVLIPIAPEVNEVPEVEGNNQREEEIDIDNLMMTYDEEHIKNMRTINSDDTDVEPENQGLKESKKKKRFSKKVNKSNVGRGSDSDSEIEKKPLLSLFGSKTTKKDNSSPRSDKSLFVISDSDATDEEDSIIQKKFDEDISCYDIPATQDNTSFQQPLNSSHLGDEDNMRDGFKLGLTNIEEMSREISVANEELADDSQVLAECHLDTHEIPAVDLRNNQQQQETNKTKEIPHEDVVFGATTQELPEFAMPSQPVPKKHPRKSKLRNKFSDDLFDSSQSEDLDFGAATQQLPATNKRQSQNDDKDDDFDYCAPTQPLTIETTKDDEQDDDVFIAPTQQMIVPRKSTRKQKEILEEDECDYIAPTQPIVLQMVKKNDAKDADEEQDDVFIAPTQELIVARKSTEKQKEISTGILDEDECDYISPTQPLVLQMNKKDDKENDDGYDCPTQPLAIASTSKSKNDVESPQKTTSIPIIVITNPPEVESQLEVLFASQNVSLAPKDTSRPSNPLAEVLASTSTQDVIDMLSTSIGGKQSVKRRSDDFEKVDEAENDIENMKPKRAKTETKVEAKKPLRRSARSNSNTSETSIKSSKTPNNNKKRSILASNKKDTGKAGKDKKVEFTPSTETKEDDDKILDNNNTTAATNNVAKSKSAFSKFSLIKKKVEPINDSDDSMSSFTCDHVEGLGIVKPIETKEMAQLVKEPSPIVKDPSPNRTLKRKFLDEISICEITANLPSPIPERKSTRSVRKPDSQEPKAGTSKQSEPEPEQKTKTTKATKKPAPKTKKAATRSTKTSAEDDEEGDSTSVAEKVEAKRPTRPTRSSGRNKTSVNYIESQDTKPTRRITRKKGKETSSDSSDNESEEELEVKIKVPAKQIKLVAIDEETFNNANNQQIEKPKRSGRTLKSGPTQQASTSKELSLPLTTPERNKRALKPKVIFTMLDDPQLNTLIRSLGGTIVDKLETSTVLVTKKIQRTLKLLSAISLGKPICSPEWLYACKRANKFLDPWLHLIQDAEAESTWNFNIRNSLETSKHGNLFADYSFTVLVTASTDVIKGAIDANGGKMVSRKPSPTVNFIVVAAANQKSKIAPFLKDNNIKVVTSEAILISVLRQEIIFDDFLLN